MLFVWAEDRRILGCDTLTAMRRVVLLLLIMAGASLAAQNPPDLAIVNARIFTGGPASPWAEAIAIQGTRIVAVGSTSDIRGRAAASTKVIDAGGKLVIPGINDAHAHPSAMPESTWLEGVGCFNSICRCGSCRIPIVCCRRS